MQEDIYRFHLTWVRVREIFGGYFFLNSNIDILNIISKYRKKYRQYTNNLNYQL